MNSERYYFKSGETICISVPHTPHGDSSPVITARSELRKVLFLALSVTFLFMNEMSRELLNELAPNSQRRRV